MSRFQLDGNMIPRSVRRMFDQRMEERRKEEGTAVFHLRGRDYVVSLANVSPSGAMIRFDGVPHIGEAIRLQLVDRAAIAGQVRWVRDGRVGISFDVPLT